MGTDERALLEAGAVLDGAGGALAGADVLTARAYRHPALDDRTVVRLVPLTLGPAEDLALEFLGFADGGEAVPVGVVARQSLGFPAWALVNDPDNGHHALAVVKEMERLTRLIATKPGSAKDGFEEIGGRLDRSVPQFLPTYYEQVARLFLAGESRTYATAFFGKARAAEQRHALPVDEDRLREVFVEFAAAGALSAKTLREHARGLAVRLSAAEAFAQFRALCLQRCAAGLAPYAGLLEDLRRLAKAAKADVAAEERTLLAEVLAGGSVQRAPVSFWKAALNGLVELARQDAGVRRRLLELMPAGGNEGRDAFDGAWLAMLESCGAHQLLLDGTVGAAQWLGSWALHRQRGWWGRSGRLPAECTLVARLAERLRADGEPVVLVRDRHRVSACDLDLLDACLTAGIPVADPPERGMLPLGDWLADRTPGRRELTALVADRRFAPLMHAAVEQLAGENDGAARLLDLAASPVLGPVVGDWLTERARDLAGPFGLPALSLQLTRLARFDAPAVLALAPQAVAALCATDAAPALARTLRAGILDELGWPALEDALQRLGVPDPAKQSGNGRSGEEWYRLHDAWPALIVRRENRVALVGADAVLDERTLTYPAPVTHSWDEPVVRHVDGQWLVLSGYGEDRRGVWSGRPADVFKPGGDLSRWQRTATTSLPLPGGGRTFGGRPVHVGDTSFGSTNAVACDGISYWVETDGEWREFDPAAGRYGRQAVPAFFDSALAEGGGAKLSRHACRLTPLPDGMHASPWGSKDGLLGWWVRQEADGRTLTACSVDGSRASADPLAPTAHVVHRWAGNNEMPLPPLRLPEGAVLHPRTCGNEIRLYTTNGLWLGTVTPGQRGKTWAAGMTMVPPLTHWHALRPRDERGSARLRTVTDADAAALLAAVAKGRTPEQAVAAVLPAVTHPALAAGIAGVVAKASRLAGRVARFAERARRPLPVGPVVAAHARDGALSEALDGLLGTRTYRYHRSNGDQSSGTMSQLRAVLRMLEGGAPEHGGVIPLEPTGVGWADLIGTGLASAAWRAASPAASENDRAALLEFLDTALAGADGLLAEPRGRLRIVELCEAKAPQERAGQVLRAAGRVLLVLSCQRVHDGARHWCGLEYDPDGAFGAWAGFDLKSAEVLGTRADPPRADAVRRMVAAVRRNGALPCGPDQAEAFAVRTNANTGAAALLLLALPGIDRYGSQRALAPQLREGYRLAAADVDLGHILLGPLTTDDRRRMTAALVPADPDAVERLWQGDFDLREAARLWLARFGRRPAVPSELLARAKREGVRPDLVVTVLSPEHQPRLTGRTRQRVDDNWLTPVDGDLLLHGSDLTAWTHALRWLAYRLPYGDPLRAVLPRTLAALRERLADPELLLDLGVDWMPETGTTSAHLRAVHGLPETGGAGPDGMVRIGTALVLTPMRYGDREAVWLRSAVVASGPEAGPGHPALELLAAAVPGARAVRALRDVLSPEFEALLGAGTADSDTGTTQDPTASVPELVEEAAGRLGCSPDAAALYLVLLALPDPTDRNTAAWTGWKPARLKAARAELAAGDLVVEAKRARAGRTLFLPGGWREESSPRLPWEVWKAALFDGAPDAFVVPDCPVPELFRRAWRRVADGDAPGFEEFVSRRGRRGGQGGAR